MPANRRAIAADPDPRNASGPPSDRWHAQPRPSGRRPPAPAGPSRGAVAVLAVLVAVTFGVPAVATAAALGRPRIVDPAATAPAAQDTRVTPAADRPPVIEFDDLLAMLEGEGELPAASAAPPEDGPVGWAAGLAIGAPAAEPEPEPEEQPADETAETAGAAGDAPSRADRITAAAAALVRIERGEEGGNDEGAVCALFDCERLGGFDPDQIRQVLAALDSGAMTRAQLATATGLSAADAEALAAALEDARA
jgi:hypothetical protein